MDGAIDQIKQKLDITEVLGEYIRLIKAGRNFKARCPFHPEKTPSFMVSQERQIWKCFGCGKGGDIFGFVKEIEGVEFADALRILARKAGVVLQRQDPQVQSQKKRLYEICELSARFFETQLEKSSAGQKAKKYLLERGMESETIKAWRVGWAPDEWRAIYDFLRGKGYKDGEIEATGMVIKKDFSIDPRYNPPTPLSKGGGGGLTRGGGGGLHQRDEAGPTHYYDRFRSRIVFPIFDLQGQIIAFGGRIFGAAKADEMAKYLNSPQTALYDKSRTLYGLHKSKTEIRIKDLCIIVEGYMDLLMSWQAGVQNVVASSGTALTEEHLKIIGRYAKNLAMSFDSDIAGDTATRRSIDLALAQDFNVKVIIMQDKDPADVVKKNPEDWKNIVAQSQSVMEFYLASTFAKFNSQQAEGRREIVKNLLPVIKSVASHTEQSEWIKELAHRLRADEKDLRLDLQKIKIQTGSASLAVSEQKNAALPNRSRREGLEERFLGLCLNNPKHLGAVSEMGEKDFENQKLGKIFCELKDLVQKAKEPDPVNFLQKSLSQELKMQVEFLSLKIEQQPGDELSVLEEIETCVKELKVVKLRQKLNNLSFEIKDAQLTGAKTKLKELLEQFSLISSELINLTKNS